MTTGKLTLTRHPKLACEHCERRNTLLLQWNGLSWSCWRPRCIRQVTGAPTARERLHASRLNAWWLHPWLWKRRYQNHCEER